MCYLDAQFLFSAWRRQAATWSPLWQQSKPSSYCDRKWSKSVLISAHPNTPQRGNKAGGRKLCCLPRETVLNGLHFCLSAYTCISEFREAKPTIFLKAILPKTAQRILPDASEVIVHKPPSLLAVKGDCHLLHSFDWANRMILPEKCFQLSDQRGSVVVTWVYGRTVNFTICYSPMCTASAA